VYYNGFLDGNPILTFPSCKLIRVLIVLRNGLPKIIVVVGCLDMSAITRSIREGHHLISTTMFSLTPTTCLKVESSKLNLSSVVKVLDGYHLHNVFHGIIW
jgi:hypothetical protein